MISSCRNFMRKMQHFNHQVSEINYGDIVHTKTTNKDCLTSTRVLVDSWASTILVCFDFQIAETSSVSERTFRRIHFTKRSDFFGSSNSPLQFWMVSLSPLSFGSKEKRSLNSRSFLRLSFLHDFRISVLVRVFDSEDDDCPPWTDVIKITKSRTMSESWNIVYRHYEAVFATWQYSL